MRRSHSGMTLFELLVVMLIIGVVYSIGIFTFKNQKVTAVSMNLTTLKTTLLALGQSGNIRMLCDETCAQCRVFTADNQQLTTARLQSNFSIKRYEFNRFGELKPLGNVVFRTPEGLKQGCFEFTLRSDGSVSPLILRSNHQFYAYIPLGADTPYVTKSEESLRQFMFKDASYPLRAEDTYGVK